MKRRDSASFSMERLERRDLMAADATLTNGLLSIKARMQTTIS